MIILGIETSGKTASVAVCNESGVLAQTSVLANRTHSQIIMPILRDTLKTAGLTLDDIDAFAVSKGPGSYTGLRIGIAAVKAFCFALNKKCAGISTLESLAYNMSGFKGYMRPVMIARNELIYTALFESGGGNNIKRVTSDEIRPLSEIISEATKLDGEVITNGDGALSFMQHADNAANNINIHLAPPHLRLQLASSLCYACFGKGEAAFISPDDLNAEYMELTKAEKDLL